MSLSPTRFADAFVRAVKIRVCDPLPSLPPNLECRSLRGMGSYSSWRYTVVSDGEVQGDLLADPVHRGATGQPNIFNVPSY
jgi:hypothetical protein